MIKEYFISSHGGGASIDFEKPEYVKDYYLSGNKLYHLVEKKDYDDLFSEARKLIDTMSDIRSEMTSKNINFEWCVDEICKAFYIWNKFMGKLE